MKLLHVILGELMLKRWDKCINAMQQKPNYWLQQKNPSLFLVLTVIHLMNTVFIQCQTIVMQINITQDKLHCIMWGLS